MHPLIDALDRFLEAASRAAKRRKLAPVERKLEKALKKAFIAQMKIVLEGFKQFKDLFPPEMSESDPLYGLTRLVGQHVLREALPGDLEPLFEKALLGTLSLFVEPIQDAAGTMMLAGAAALIKELNISGGISYKNPRVAAYLEAHGAELVKQIDEITREDMRQVVNTAMDQGWSYKKTSKAIRLRYQGYYDEGSWWNFDAPRPQKHIQTRAHLIAVTESGEAYESGAYAQIEELRDQGIETEKFWRTMGDDRVSDGCRANEADGWIPADHPHTSGHMHPLRFPGCRCDEEYRVKAS